MTPKSDALRSEAIAAAAPLRQQSPAPARTVPGLTVLVLFTLTAFTGSALLFLVQPMFARLVLPHLGGSPSVWNTCMLFFQALLLLGYLYAHLGTNALAVRTHAVAHLLLLAAPLGVLPIAVNPPDGGLVTRPAVWLLVTAALTVGLPFFVLSTSAPLLQRWFAALPHPTARSPYFLYAASNLGSLLALLGYPFVLEPLVGLAAQTRIWAWGYGLFALLTAGCAAAVRAFAAAGPTAAAGTAPAAAPLTWPVRLWWLLLAFVPSSLMLGVTTHISTDIAAFPLLWIAPLSIYLLTFVIAFSSATPLRSTVLAAPTGLLTFGTFVSLMLNVQSAWLVPLHLLTFAAAALLCHLRLAHSRPAVSRLTEFYIWLSLGGVLGGIVNSVIAPAVFRTVLEYPLALAAVILIAAASGKPGPGAPAALKRVLLAAVVLIVVSLALPDVSRLRHVRLLASIVLVALTMLERRNLGVLVRLTVLVAAMGVVSAGRARPGGNVVHTERSFFGVHRIVDARDGSHRTLYHGSTLHGWQALPAAGCEPSSYYSRKGPIGDIFAASGGRFERVGAVGLGTGALACYAGPGDSWTFYEIDPAIERLATNPAYFNQIANSPGRVDVVVADGRLGLQRAPAGSYDLIVLDAFSSDAIPVHLLTREAMEVYFSRLAPRGVVALHISNRYLKLEPVVAALGRDLGVHGYIRTEAVILANDARLGRTSSTWVVLARRPEDALALGRARGWRALEHTPGVRVWTDDYANVLQALLLNYGRR